MAANKSGPINQDFIDRQTKSPMQSLVDAKAGVAQAGMRIRTDASAGARNAAAMSKAASEQLANTEALNTALAGELATHEMLTKLERARLKLTEKHNKATQSNNKEVVEHYKNLVHLNAKQISHVKQTLQLENRRVKLAGTLTHLENKRVKTMENGKGLAESELKLQTKTRTELERTVQVLEARTRVEKESVKNNKSIAEARKEALKTDADIAAYNDKLARKQARKPSIGQTVSEQVAEGVPGQTGGILSRIKGSVRSGVGGIAGAAGAALGAVSSYELLKAGLTSLSRASDMATESQYHFGTSMDRSDRSLMGYASRTARVVALNNAIGLSFVQMGLSAEEAQEIVPKLLTTSGIAQRAFQENDKGTIETMAKAAGAFARQTGVSLDDAVALQNTLVSTQGKSAEQAAADLNKITGSIQGMNNYMQDAGFRGALLNIGEYANMAREAAENTEDLSFNTSDYAERLAVAAKNVRLMGATEKEASKFAAAKGKLYEQKNAFVDMQVGKKLLTSLQSEYSEQIRTGDADTITKSLVEKHGLASNQAALAASYLVSKKSTPMLANQMAEILRGSAISRSTIDSTLDEWMSKTGITSKSQVGLIVNDPTVMSQLGLDFNSAQDKLTAVDYATEYLIRKGMAKPDTELAKRMEKLRSDKEYQDSAAEQAKSKNLENNAPMNIGKVVDTVQTRANNPLFSIPTGLAVGAASVFGWKKYGAKRLTALQESLTKSAGGPTAKAVEQIGGDSATKKLIPRISDLVKHNKKMALLAGALGLGSAAVYGGAKYFGREVADSGASSAAPQEDFVGTTKGNAINASGVAAGDLALKGAGWAGKAGLSKFAPGLMAGAATKVAGGKAASTLVKGIPFVGSLISGAMTYALTEGNWKRKAAAAGGDMVGGLLGSFLGPVGGIAGGAAGQFAGTQLYDMIAGTDAKSSLNTDGALSRASGLDASSTPQAGTATQAQPGSSSMISGASFGKFGTVNPDGSVNAVLNVRLQNFVPAVSQANTQAYAKVTQYSGAQK